MKNKDIRNKIRTFSGIPSDGVTLKNVTLEEVAPKVGGFMALFGVYPEIRVTGECRDKDTGEFRQAWRSKAWLMAAGTCMSVQFRKQAPLPDETAFVVPVRRAEPGNVETYVVSEAWDEIELSVPEDR